jgi:hypothetical protein
VIGVMPEGFRFLDMEPAAEVISLITLDRSRLRIGGFGYSSLARLKPGMTVADANADIARMLPIWLNAWPTPPNAPRQSFESWRITPVVQPLKDEVVGGVGDLLWVLMATIGMVLLIACANVANLMLVRSESRRQEFAVRTALGARRGDIVREVLVESLALSSSAALWASRSPMPASQWWSQRRRRRCRVSRTSRSIRASWRLPSWSRCSRACCSARCPR